jgi:hypothetical protein
MNRKDNMTATATAPSTLRVYKGEGAETIRLAELSRGEILTPTFQRERLIKQIEKFAADFDKTAYAFPTVALFRGHYINLDGQQRLASCELRGDDEVVVMLVEGVATKERLAELFLKINRDRKLLTSFQKFVGALEAKDPGAVAMNKLVDAYDLTMSKSGTQYGHVPTGSIVKIYERGGAEQLERTLRIRQQAWGATPSREAHEGKTLIGLATFIGRFYEHIEDERLVTVLRKLHPAYILTMTDKSSEQKISYAEFLRREYNRGLRGKGKLE